MIVRALILVMLSAFAPQSQQALLAERNALGKQADDAFERRDLPAAIALAARLLAFDRRTFGDVHPAIADSLHRISLYCEAALDLQTAERHAVELHALMSQLSAPAWRVTDARLRVARLRRRLTLSAAENQLLQATGVRHESAYRRAVDGRFREAAAIFEELLPIRRRLLGPSDNETITNITNLASMLTHLGEYVRARELFAEALAAHREARGDDHPATARSRIELAELFIRIGDYESAEAPLWRALATSEQQRGEAAGDTLKALNALGVLYDEMRDVARAVELHNRALSIKRKSLSETDPEIAVSLINLGRVYASMADDTRAQALWEEALGIFRSNGRYHPALTDLLASLGVIYVRRAEFDRAESMYRNALEIDRQVLGENHPDVAVTLNNLALMYLEKGEPDRAAPLFDQGIAITRKSLGASHPAVAMALNNAATLYVRRKDYARAAAMYREAVDLQRKVLPPRHPDLAATLQGLGSTTFGLGDPARAEPLIREALDISLWNLDLASAAQSERQLLLMTAKAREHLESYLALAGSGGASPAAAWAQTMGWKGRAMARQRASRAAASHPQTRALFDQLRDVASELSQLALAATPASAVDATTRRIAVLSDRKEDLERQLARAGSGLQIAHVTPLQVRASIPASAVLLDCFEAGGRFIVFIVRAEGEIQAVDLGPSKTIGEAIERWHVLTRSAVDAAGTADKLKQLVWSPIDRLLQPGEMVLMSAEGAMGSLAFGALPGRAPGRFLLHDRAMVTITAPSMLPELLAARPAAGSAGPLLAVGDVNYDAARVERPAPAGPRPSRIAPRGAGDAFESLPSTVQEIGAIEKLYRSRFGAAVMKTLSGVRAREGAFRDEAPKHAFLHLATHGFFADARFKSALSNAGARSFGSGAQSIAGYHPGLLSGLVFAGANNPSADDDGILTADEVATLNLSGVRLAVLSACETGAGLAAGGEGLLGLQRAFQAAGARSVIATMWNVDDEATRAVMTRFYDNLWTKKMGTLDALREAQLWMLGTDQKHPFYWGAFVLSGDWR